METFGEKNQERELVMYILLGLNYGFQTFVKSMNPRFDKASFFEVENLFLVEEQSNLEHA